MKVCTKCKKELELDCFYKDKWKKDGFHTVCKKCSDLTKKMYHSTEEGKKWVHDYRRSEAVKLRSREFEKTEERRAWRRDWRKTQLAKQLRIKHNERIRQLGRDKIYDKVRQAIEKGFLKKQSCKICGSFEVLAHHPNYLKPLDVIWLCQKHHNQLHKNMIRV